MNVTTTPHQTYSLHALKTFEALENRVRNAFNEVQAWRGWKLISDPSTEIEDILSLVQEIFLSVTWYQEHSTEAGFHMIGRLPKCEVELMRALCSHKAEEAEHGLWARDDYIKLGGRPELLKIPLSPATYAVAAVWWRMAYTEDAFGYLGAEYLFEKLTALVTQSAVTIIEQRKLNEAGLRFVIEHATEDEKHASFIKHRILDVVTRYPSKSTDMLRCFDYFNAVYPLPVWDEAYKRALCLQPKRHV